MEFVTKVKALWTMLSSSAKAQTMILSTLGVLAIGGAGIGGFSVYEHFYGPEAVVSAEVNTESSQMEMLIAQETETETETELVIETETETEMGPTLVKLVGSSIEKDLKIKIQNEEERNVKGEEFYITVTPDKKNAKASTYNDHDNDGIIYIKDIDGGDYLVALEEIEGYYTDKESIKVTVKEHIEYVKVEVKDEIKTEAEVSPEEDAQIKDEVEVEAEIQDTVPWLDSKVIATAVSASTLDKTQYQTGVASVGANGAVVTVPQPATAAVVSFSYKNLFLVRTGTEDALLPLTEGGTTENPDAGSQTEPGDGTGGETTTPGTGDGTGGESTTPGTGDGTGGETTTTVTPAKLSMPATASMFASARGAANTVEFSINIEDTAQIVNQAGITWAVKSDGTGDGTAGSGIVVAGNGKTVKISSANAKKAGTAVVTATIPYTSNGTSATATLECTITVNTDAYDPTIVLEDSAGDVLYTDNDCTVTATVADLIEKNVGTFYKNPKYQGWQTLNGKLYYYNADGVPVTGEQTISGMMYTFGADGALVQNTTTMGIDVSKYQPNVDWKTVKASGIDFVIIRVGYRGSATGVLVEDPYFKQHIKGATDAGLKVGVYFFTQAITKAEAVEEASMALALTEGYNLQYPIFIDTERVSGNARANNLDKATRTEIVDAFCKTVQNAGRRAGVYASKSWYNNQLNASVLEKYYIWVAQYNTECNYTGKYHIWQYTETGSVPGISGNVDLNISYMN